MNESHHAKGTLTGTQQEVMDAVWARGGEGATVAEIWRALSRKREMARTTALTLVIRLERRGWLARRPGAGGVLRYHAAVPREQASRRLAKSFVDQFFGGSASELVMSLLGSGRVKREEIERLRKILDEAGGKS